MRCFNCIVLAGLAMTLASCSGKDAGEDLETFPVTGKVLLDDQPTEGVTVTYFPSEGTKGKGGAGVTDAQGQFTLIGSDGKEGVPGGKYRILFTMLRTPDGKPIPPDAMAADVQAENVLPDLYNDPGNTPMGATVSSTGSDPSEFAIKGKTKGKAKGKGKK